MTGDERVANDERLRIAHSEAVRLIEQQEATLAGLHTRAAVLVSAAAVATAFLATVTRTGESLPFLAVMFIVLAVVAFVFVYVCALAILWPQEYVFGRSGLEILRNYVHDQEDGTKFSADEVVHDLVLHLDQNHLANQLRLDRSFKFLRGGIAALGLEILFWLASTVR